MGSAREVTVCVTRVSGGEHRGASDAERIGETLAKAGVTGRIELLSGGEIADRAQAAVEDKAELLIVAGGDGSVSAAAGELAGSDTRLGILPLGTRNHFARDLAVPLKLEDAASLIASGPTRSVDVAEVNGRTFINNSAIGFYPLMVVDRDLQRRHLRRSKRLAMLVASIRTLARFEHRRLTLTVNDRKAVVDTPLLFVGNNDYRLALGATGRRRSLEDGELSVFVMRKKTRSGFIAACLRALLDRSRANDMVRLEGVGRLRVSTRRSELEISLDGEVVRLEPPLDYTIRKRALSVIAP